VKVCELGLEADQIGTIENPKMAFRVKESDLAERQVVKL
jgi:hypothetical protein